MNKFDAFEYIVLQMGRCYVQANGMNNFAEFNEWNNFDKKKCLLLPFFIATANSGRQFFFEKCFDKIIANAFGHVDSEIVAKVENQKEESFQRIEITFTRTIVKDSNLLRVASENDQLKSAIKNSFTIEEGDEALIRNIDHSIDDILFEPGKIGFESFSSKVLSAYSQRHLSWVLFNDANDNKIPASFLIQEKSMYSEEQKYRMYI